MVNVKFTGLDPFVRRKFSEALKFMVPHARHTPSFKLGRWDGKVSFATVGGATYLNLLDRVLPIIIDEGYDIEIDDQRPNYGFTFPEVCEEIVADRCWPDGHPMAGEPIMLRDYQVDAINRYLANLQSMQSISTGAGKTLLTATLSLICEPHGRTLVIVPSKSLVEQTEEDYRNLGLDVGVFYGERKEWGHQHTIASWQSLAVLSKVDIGTKPKKATGRAETQADPGITIEDFLDGVVCVMADECHTVRGDVLRKLLCGPMSHIPIRWGMTGTVPKDEHEYMSLLASIGPVVGEVKASDLQEKGVLANCAIEVLQLEDDHVEFRDYTQEYDFLVRDKDRIKWLADQTIRLSETTGNTLVLVDRIDTGEMLAQMIPGSVFISGQTRTKDRKAEFKEVSRVDNKVIIATFGVASVGINAPRIFNLIFLECGKSFVRTIQSIGRILRKANDKDSATVFDVTSTLKFSKRHLSKRKSYYEEANYPHRVTKIRYR
jgi:superfamily II DNA or RNA helicase